MLKLIRKAKLTDLIEINKLGEQLHPGFARLFHMETEIDSNISIVFVSDSEDGINGYLYAQNFGDNIDILSVFVDNKYRNRHIATNLIIKLMEENKTITLEVKEDNFAALALYNNLGFKIVATRKKYYDDKDAYIMKWGS